VVRVKLPLLEELESCPEKALKAEPDQEAESVRAEEAGVPR
jgi:hypothetical protein